MAERTLLATGREAEVYLEADGNVLKLYLWPDDVNRAERELSVARTLRAAGHPVPKMLGATTVDRRPGILMERLDGRDLLATLERSPLRVFTAGSTLAAVHVDIHEHPAPSILPDLVGETRRKITKAQLLPAAHRDQVLSLLDRLPQGNAVCHGDFHLGNMLGSWEDVRVIDWGSATRGHYLADVARTELLHRVAVVPPDTSAVFKVMVKVGRGLLVNRYLATYAAHRPIDRALLAEWYVVCAASRLSESIPGEDAALLDIVEKWCDGRR